MASLVRSKLLSPAGGKSKARVGIISTRILSLNLARILKYSLFTDTSLSEPVTVEEAPSNVSSK